MAKAKIHRTAIVDSKAKFSEGVEIGPYCIVGKRVKLGKNARLISNVNIQATEIGADCTVYPFATIGLPPQDAKYKGEKTKVKIGDKNVIREYVSIHRASIDGERETRIGNDNFLMAYAHVAHDCNVHNNVVMANGATLGGYVTVEDHAFIGGLVAIHQFVRIGAFSMIGGFSAVTQDVPPYTTAVGDRARLCGLNTIGLKRHDFSGAQIKELKDAYKILFHSNLTMKDALARLKQDGRDSREVKNLVEFIERNKRGVLRKAAAG